MGDVIGHKRWIFISLILSFLLLLLGKHNLYVLTASIGLLQSSIPITVILMIKSIHNYPATAVALELGSSVLISGLIIFGSIELGISEFPGKNIFLLIIFSILLFYYQ